MLLNFTIFLLIQLSSDDDKKKIGILLKSSDYDIREFLYTIFLSKDFYSNKLTKIKSPVELVVGTHKLLDLDKISGVPDFNLITSNLGQSLFFHLPLQDGPKIKIGLHLAH